MTIIGQAGIKFIGTRTRMVPGSGITTVFLYAADSTGDADSFGAAQYQSGNQVDVDNTKPPYMVEVSAPTSSGGTSEEDYSDRWEITPVDNDKAYTEHPFFQAIANETNGSVKQAAVRNFAKNPNEYDVTTNISTYDESIDDLITAGGSAAGVSFLDLIARGSDHYQTAASAVRFTRTFGDGYTAIAGAFASANKIWTGAQIIALGAPPIYAAAINAAEANGPAAASGYQRGWLKKQPSITQRGTGRSDLVQEWVLENWSTFLYGTA